MLGVPRPSVGTAWRSESAQCSPNWWRKGWGASGDGIRGSLDARMDPNLALATGHRAAEYLLDEDCVLCTPGPSRVHRQKHLG